MLGNLILLRQNDIGLVMQLHGISRHNLSAELLYALSALTDLQRLSLRGQTYGSNTPTAEDSMGSMEPLQGVLEIMISRLSKLRFLDFSYVRISTATVSQYKS